MKILLVVLSTLFVVRNIGTYIQPAQFEIVEENYCVREESIQQQLILKKVVHHVFTVTHLIPASTGYPNSQPALTVSRWLYHRAILT